LPCAHANQYKILVTGASFTDTKRVGAKSAPWDIGNGRPDAYVVVSFNNQPVYVSGAHKDSLQARWFTGTEYWKLPLTTRVTVTVRDADAAKMVAGIGMFGVAMRPDIPKVGKRAINAVLSEVDTDDAIATWSGTLGQLLQACGRREVDLMRSAVGKPLFKANVGMTSLRVRVVERPLDFEVTAPKKRQYLGLSGATLAARKRRGNQAWDIGVGAGAQPDPRYLVYVNGSPVVSGGVNRDSLLATWAGNPVPLDLRADDTIAVAVFDADAGSQLSAVGKAAAIYSPSLSAEAKQRVFETLTKMSTDDLIFLWVGDWATLVRSAALPTAAKDPHVWWNNGLQRADVMTRPRDQRVSGAPMQLIVRSATVRATKTDGKSWDRGRGKPDPLVKCSVPAAQGGWKLIGQSKPATDSVNAVWNLSVVGSQLTGGARVKLDVFDKDALSDDLIESVVVTLPSKPGMYSVRSGALVLLTYELVARGK